MEEIRFEPGDEPEVLVLHLARVRAWFTSPVQRRPLGRSGNWRTIHRLRPRKPRFAFVRVMKCRAGRSREPSATTQDVIPLLRCLSCYFPCFFRFAAQYAFMRWDCSLRAAADIPPFRFLGGADGGATVAAGPAPAEEFFGERPRLLMGPWRASIARLSLSRSATSSARM